MPAQRGAARALFAFRGGDLSGLLAVDRCFRFSSGGLLGFGSGGFNVLCLGLGSGFLRGRLIADSTIERLLTRRREERKPYGKRHERKGEHRGQPSE